jgi:hypothetical protein
MKWHKNSTVFQKKELKHCLNTLRAYEEDTGEQMEFDTYWYSLRKSSEYENLARDKRCIKILETLEDLIEWLTIKIINNTQLH